jgi:hypothetical protein
MKKPRTWRIDNPVYRYTLHLRHGGAIYDANEWARKILGGGEFGEGFVLGRCYTNDARLDHLIWISQPAGHDVVAHEALHSVAHIATLVGFPQINHDTDEPYCYLLGWTVAEIGSRIWK